MKQYTLDANELTLRVNKSPIFVRALMFLFAILFFVLPILGFVSYASMGKGLHIGSFVLIFLFGLMGFYLLRLALWNTYGKEKLSFKTNECTYLADYGWFKDAIKTKEFKTYTFSIKPIGYIEDQKGVLLIEDSKTQIECATKMPIETIEALIEELIKKYCV
nr:hypothetical protein [uncultured Psychroserpens sp.]